MPITPFKIIQGHRFWYGEPIYDFLLVNNTNLPPILHRFRGWLLVKFSLAIGGASL